MTTPHITTTRDIPTDNTHIAYGTIPNTATHNSGIGNGSVHPSHCGVSSVVVGVLYLVSDEVELRLQVREVEVVLQVFTLYELGVVEYPVEEGGLGVVQGVLVLHLPQERQD